jgi:hypothetical protein
LAKASTQSSNRQKIYFFDSEIMQIFKGKMRNGKHFSEPQQRQYSGFCAGTQFLISSRIHFLCRNLIFEEFQDSFFLPELDFL